MHAPALPCVALLAVTLAVTACGRPGEETAAPSATPSARAPAPSDGLDWRFSNRDGEAELTYGDGDLAEGERLLSMSCAPGSGRVRLERPAYAPTDAPLFLQSSVDGERVSFEAGEAALPADRPVLQSFRRTARLVTGEGPQRRVMAGRAAAADQIESFFAFCGG